MDVELVRAFNSVRDIPYRIPLKVGEPDNCCSGKSRRLLSLLEGKGLEVRYRACWFKWSDMKLPTNVSHVPHEDDCTHTYLEANINGKWHVIDPTWDKPLGKHFNIAEWDGHSGTKNAVKPTKILSPEESRKLVESEDDAATKEDLRKNGEFYKAFNEWLETLRHAAPTI